MLLGNISPVVIYGENIVRIIVFTMMFFMPIQIAKTSQKQGVLLFILGT
jgi:hypothetical protein